MRGGRQTLVKFHHRNRQNKNRARLLGFPIDHADGLYFVYIRKEKIMAEKGTPKKDGSGGGKRANEGRGGCKTTKKEGQGQSQQKK